MNPVQIAAFISANSERRLDSRETALLGKQLEYVKSRTYDVKYPEMRARRFIPVSNEANAGAQSITYRQWDGYGMAKIVANAADDLPLVDVVAKEFTIPVHSLGSAFKYDIQELRAAAMAQAQLDLARAKMARRAIEAGVDQIAAYGKPQAQQMGFLNHPNVPVISPNTGTWASASVENILKDLNKLVNSIVTATGTVHSPDTLLLDTASFALLASTPTGADLGKTILRVFLDTNPYIRNIDQWNKLDTASAAGGRRIVAYVRDSEILELEIPLEFEQLPPQPRNLAFVVNCHSRIGGTVIRYPLAIAYMDGI